jgi:hypothetical protein
MRSGIFISTDQPLGVRATLASQFSSQSDDESVSLKSTASVSTPPALTVNWKALLWSRRVPRSTSTRSDSTRRSRRDRCCTTGA